MPLSYFESSQTVGDVAQVMIKFYLAAAGRPTNYVITSDRQPPLPPSAFDGTGLSAPAGHDARVGFSSECGGPLRDTSPLQPAYEADIRRVLSDINALPPVERAWTLLFVRTKIFLTYPDTLVPDAELMDSLQQVVGPDDLMRFLAGQTVTEDPDLRQAEASHSEMVRFILAHAPQLLRPSDAEAVHSPLRRDFDAPRTTRSSGLQRLGCVDWKLVKARRPR